MDSADSRVDEWRVGCDGMQSAAACFFSCFLFSPSLSLFPQNTISLGVVMKAAVELMIRRREGVVGLGRREGGG